VASRDRWGPSRRTKRPIAILQDLAGPKIRVGAIPDPGIMLEAGEIFVLTGRKLQGSKKIVSVSYANLPKEVKPGDRLLLADGMMELTVNDTDGTDITCRVITGGMLTSQKGINLPTGAISAPSLTDKDRKDLLFGLKHNVDYIALSFVKKGGDITALKDLIRERGKDVSVIAKIEKHEAVENLDAIIAASDGIMVARGDLGVEIPPEEVPFIPKMIIQKSNAAGKPRLIEHRPALYLSYPQASFNRFDHTYCPLSVNPSYNIPLKLSHVICKGRFP